jgi:predicted porin
MKKSLLALAVTAALTAPLAAQADTILYGSARVSIDYNDESNSLFNGDGSWDIANNSSRLGVLGSEDLGGGLSAVYQYEFGVDISEGGNLEGNRPKFVGLKGGFGQISLGTQETPYYHVGGIVDIFNTDKSLGSTGWLGGSFNGFKVNLVNDRDLGDGSLFRLENSIYYTTPDFNGFSAEAMLVLDGTGDTVLGTPNMSDGIDIWSVNVKYNQGPYFAGLTYIKLNGDSTMDMGQGRTADLDLANWGLGLGYKTNQWLVGLIYEQGDFADVNFDRHVRVNGVPLATGNDASSWYLTGQYAFGNNTLRAAYGQTDTGIDGEDTIDNWRLGYQYNFSKRTLIWVEYSGRDANTPLYGDQDVVSIGTRHYF